MDYLRTYVLSLAQYIHSIYCLKFLINNIIYYFNFELLFSKISLQYITYITKQTLQILIY